MSGYSIGLIPPSCDFDIYAYILFKYFSVYNGTTEMLILLDTIEQVNAHKKEPPFCLLEPPTLLSHYLGALFF